MLILDLVPIPTPGVLLCYPRYHNYCCPSSRNLLTCCSSPLSIQHIIYCLLPVVNLHPLSKLSSMFMVPKSPSWWRITGKVRCTRNILTTVLYLMLPTITEEDPLDRELQSTELARIMAASHPGPVIFLGYVVTQPMANRRMFFHVFVVFSDKDIFQLTPMRFW